MRKDKAQVKNYITPNFRYYSKFFLCGICQYLSANAVGFNTGYRESDINAHIL